MKRVSIKDVAKEAGVSTTTVSYVLNRHPGETISAETTQRVLDAAKRLNYVPNLNARSLSSRHTNLIGVVIPQTEPGKEFMFSNPFYGELLSAIEYTARKSGYHLLLSGTREDQNYASIAQNRGVDGIIIVASPQDLVGMVVEKAVKMAEMMNVPIVGLVENMSYVACPDCGKKIYLFGEGKTAQAAAAHNLPLLAEMPIDPALASLTDAGSIEDFQGDWLKTVADRLAEK